MCRKEFEDMNENNETEGRRCCRRDMGESGPRCHRGPHGHHGFHGHPGREHFDPEFLEKADLHILLRAAFHSMRHARFGNTQDRILKILAENKEMDQRQLQEELHVRPGSMSEIISKLEDKGLVLRERSEDDRRHATLSLSEEGMHAASSIEIREPVKALSDEEEETLRQLLLKMVRSSAPEKEEV